jgi:penicillin amidase
LREALNAALDWIEERLGPEMESWQWKAIHRTGPVHTLSASFPELASQLNPPTVGVGGDSDTPQAGGFGGIGAGDFKIMGASVNRYAFDLDDWERSGWVVPLGSSGHPGSKHFADQVEAWSEQRLYPMYYAWSVVEQHAETKQKLTPSN